MKQLRELTKYTVSKYGETLAPQGYVYSSDEVEELVSELDDAFENCKMNLESEKATIEELQEKLNEMKRDYGTVEPDDFEGLDMGNGRIVKK